MKVIRGHIESSGDRRALLVFDDHEGGKWYEPGTHLQVELLDDIEPVDVWGADTRELAKSVRIVRVGTSRVKGIWIDGELLPWYTAAVPIKVESSSAGHTGIVWIPLAVDPGGSITLEKEPDPPH